MPKCPQNTSCYTASFGRILKFSGAGKCMPDNRKSNLERRDRMIHCRVHVLFILSYKITIKFHITHNEFVMNGLLQQIKEVSSSVFCWWEMKTECTSEHERDANQKRLFNFKMYRSKMTGQYKISAIQRWCTIFSSKTKNTLFIIYSS